MCIALRIDTKAMDRFYNIEKDIYEEHPLPQNSLTQDQKRIKNEFEDVLSAMDKEMH